MKTKHKGLTTFFIIWIGQLVSLLGTKMTRFALLIWVYQETGQATAMALLGVFGWGAAALIGPIAGYWVDKLDKRRVMLWSDFGAGLTTILILILMAQGDLQLWHLYLSMALTGFLDAFQFPAYMTATSVLVPKQHYGRTSGMRSLGASVADVVAPMIAGVLLFFIGVQGVMLIDVVTFLFAVLTLTFIFIPNPEPQPIEDEGETFWQQITFGFRYIWRHEGLFGLMLVMVIINFFAALTYYGIFPAMILARTGGSELALSTVQASLGVGGIVGGILMSIWGGPKRKIHGVLLYTAISFIVGDFLFAIGRTTPVWVVAGIGAAAFIPFIVGCSAAIWQAKVPPHIQGRVMNAQYTLRELMHPIGYLAGGLLADFVFEPAMMPNGFLAPLLGGIVGTGDGAGMAVMFLITGIGGVLTGFGGYLFVSLRNVETDLPDHDTA
jgi:MFS transporter, DHA3 family, macrolide efflux protein